MPLPIVSMTVHRAQALEAGFSDHLGKPVAPEELVALLARVFRTRTGRSGARAPEKRGRLRAPGRRDRARSGRYARGPLQNAGRSYGRRRPTRP